MEKGVVLQIAVCEDDLNDSALLARHIEKSGIAAELCNFENGEEFLASFCARKYDLIFMDIYMKGMDGVETVRKIRGLDRSVVIAFMTGSADHALESYRLGAVKYLEKPVTENGVTETLAYALMKRDSEPFVTLTAAGGGQENIPLDSILYFEQNNYVVEVHTSNRVITTSRSVRLDGLEKRLPSPPFLRCHRSYLINLDHVHTFDKENNAFIMKNGDRADIRRGSFAMCKTELNKWRLDNAGGDDF